MLIRLSFGSVLLMGAALVVGTWSGARIFAQGWSGDAGPSHGGPPVYQPYPIDGHRRDYRRDRRWDWRDMRYQTPEINSGTFQRPYPYHLDYYKMRYGGSYAPYFGNLYGTPFGTPQVVNYPPYYGPYYSGNGNGSNAMPTNNGVISEYADTAAPTATETTDPTPKANGEQLPIPKQ